jgi:hypothetical protein
MSRSCIHKYTPFFKAYFEDEKISEIDFFPVLHRLITVVSAKKI